MAGCEVGCQPNSERKGANEKANCFDDDQHWDQGGGGPFWKEVA